MSISQFSKEKKKTVNILIFLLEYWEQNKITNRFYRKEAIHWKIFVNNKLLWRFETNFRERLQCEKKWKNKIYKRSSEKNERKPSSSSLYTIFERFLSKFAWFISIIKRFFPKLCNFKNWCGRNKNFFNKNEKSFFNLPWNLQTRRVK